MSPLLNLHSQNDKVAVVDPCHLPKFWDKKPKETTKVTLRATHQVMNEFLQRNLSTLKAAEKSSAAICSSVPVSSVRVYPENCSNDFFPPFMTYPYYFHKISGFRSRSSTNLKSIGICENFTAECTIGQISTS